MTQDPRNIKPVAAYLMVIAWAGRSLDRATQGPHLVRIHKTTAPRQDYCSRSRSRAVPHPTYDILKLALNIALLRRGSISSTNTRWNEWHGRDLRRTRGWKRCQTASGLHGSIGVGMIFGAARGVAGVVDEVNTTSLYVSWGISRLWATTLLHAKCRDNLGRLSGIET